MRTPWGTFPFNTLTTDEGQKLSETDARTNTTQFTYYPSGDLELVRNALGGKTRYTYDAVSRVLSIADALGTPDLIYLR